MIRVASHENKMLQAFGMAFVAEILLLMLLFLGVAGLQKLRQRELLTSAIIQINGSPGQQKPVTAPHEQKKQQVSLPRPRSVVKPSQFVPKQKVTQTVADRQPEQTAAVMPTNTQAVSSEPARFAGFSTQSLGADGRSSDKEDPLAAYAAQVKAAVQASVEYPADAYNLRIKSRVRVEFSLRDGVQQNPHIIKSSGLSVFDRAAIHVIETTHYPAPPHALIGQMKLFQVWVEFSR